MSMKVPTKLQEQASAVGMTVENDAYDIGYFKRYFGWPREGGDRQRQGWSDCNQQLADEGRDAHPNAVHEAAP
ncbi:hypothetical protein MPL3356_60561 [Mesorhizobium plurifarium]|uniref:Uncharacterized protein n=1 Tax=Mesorhizobium plurifarium TaxID=69974 RepID=A0A090EA46_MESPL|nr:hypothetical protein MPL3356_60561 [Mesorhizobium plurifarium]